jgi:hypothetical protein
MFFMEKIVRWEMEGYKQFTDSLVAYSKERSLGNIAWAEGNSLNLFFTFTGLKLGSKVGLLSSEILG